jgi:hypothetical protein
MNKYLLKTIFFFTISTVAVAQSKDEKIYKERAAEIQQEVWDSGDKAFEVKHIPDKYKNESAVIIAKSFYHAVSTIGKGYIRPKYLFYTVNRKRLMINDKNSLAEYSSLAYKKEFKEKELGGLFLKFSNSLSTYVGAKVIKPNGDIKITTLDDEVLTKKETNNKDGKLAIADLQVGDILDYYVCIEEKVENLHEIQIEKRSPDIFLLADDYPILYYNIKYVIEKDCGIDILNMNGANRMSKILNKDKNILMELTETDLPKLSNTIWISIPRQISILIVSYGLAGIGSVAKSGEVKYGPFTEVYKNDLKNNIFSITLTKSSTSTDKKRMEDYFGGKNEIKNAPADSIINYLYNYYRWVCYGGFLDMDVSNKRNFKSMPLSNFVLHIRDILNDNDIENSFVLVSDRFSKRLSDVFEPRDFQTFIKIKSSGKISWICLNDFFQDAGQLAPNYQGEQALILDRVGNGKNSKFASNETSITLPVSKAAENLWSENLKINFNKDNLQTISIQRNCSKTGAIKVDDQKKLLLSEDIEGYFASLVKMPKKMDYYSEDKKLNSKVEEIQTAMKIEKAKQKDYFKEEIKEQYNQSPKELTEYKITNLGLSYNKPAFEYTEKFIMEDFVKKAGNNFIFEVGRLMGSYKKLDEKERNRTLDVYIPSARTLTYSFAIVIPDGYIAKGVEELNKKVENDIASFASTATLSDNTVNVTVTRIYNNNFEPAANWPKLLTVMDAAADFTTMKLLLEKEIKR